MQLNDPKFIQKSVQRTVHEHPETIILSQSIQALGNLTAVIASRQLPDPGDFFTIRDSIAETYFWLMHLQEIYGYDAINEMIEARFERIERLRRLEQGIRP